MVYYYTSKNIKLLRNIIIEYESLSEISPHEYIKNYIESCSEDIEESKISWIIESFLGTQKHHIFLQGILCQVPESLSEEDQSYFMIVLHAVIFQITPNEMSPLYKSLFNLSKPLLNSFSKLFYNADILPVISEIAQVEYDTNFVTKNIISSLFAWQPYFREMNNNYKEYVHKVEVSKSKPLTIPIDSVVLNRKGKKATHVENDFVPSTPPNSLYNKNNKMLTKSKIDQNLKIIHDKNRQKAKNLTNIVKNMKCHYAQDKIVKTNIYDNVIKANLESKNIKPLKHSKPSQNPPPTVKETTATIKKLNQRIKQSEQEEIKWLQDLIDNCNNTSKVDELLNYDRQEREKERILDIEKKHLMGQISYEEAVIAKKNLYEDNKRKHEKFLEEKQIWEKEIEEWKMLQTEKNRKQIENISLMEIDMLNAKHNATMRKKEIADKLRQESEECQQIVLRNKQMELERRINMIKEIKIIAMLAKTAKLPKIIDLTESSGFGLLCEMSVAELQERLAAMKISLNEELEIKRNEIKRKHLENKCELEETKESIMNYLTEKAETRKERARTKVTTDILSQNKEINKLKKILEEKRNLRMTFSK